LLRTRPRLAAAFAASLIAHAGVLVAIDRSMRFGEGSSPKGQWARILRVDLPNGSDRATISTDIASPPGEPAAEPDLSESGIGKPGEAFPLPGSDESDFQSQRFLPSAVLDRSAFPIGAPDQGKYLTGSDIPAIPFRLRLYVDEQGAVVKVEVKRPTPIDEASLQPVKDMFMATPFVPGRLKGRDVPSYLDIEVCLEDLVPRK
jgi:hypothetical protein